MTDDLAIRALRGAARPLVGDAEDYDPLLELIGDARFVLLGEASHGTHEFYRERAQITKRLIREKGFTAVAVEADWPDAYRVNRYVRGARRRRRGHRRAGGLPALPDLDVAQRRRARLRRLAPRPQRRGSDRGEPEVGFYGLDLYSLHASIEAVLAYLDKVDPEAAERARARYACFDDFGEDPQAYGYAAALRARASPARTRSSASSSSCAAAPPSTPCATAGSPRTSTSTPSRTRGWCVNAEQYYRTMFRGRGLVLEPARPPHGRDARRAGRAPRPRGAAGRRSWSGPTTPTSATRARPRWGRRGELNVGQLVRERHGRDAVSGRLHHLRRHGDGRLGLGRAGRAEAGPPGAAGELRGALPRRRPGRASCSTCRGDDRAAGLREPRLERAIGVIYRPETERPSHYFHASLPAQFDAVLHFDQTRAVEPLERTAEWEAGEVPETFPSGV